MKTRAELENIQRRIGTIAAMLKADTMEERKIIAEVAIQDTRTGHGVNLI